MQRTLLDRVLRVAAERKIRFTIVVIQKPVHINQHEYHGVGNLAVQKILQTRAQLNWPGAARTGRCTHLQRYSRWMSGLHHVKYLILRGQLHVSTRRAHTTVPRSRLAQGARLDVVHSQRLRNGGAPGLPC